jgi:hypothetical protein
VILLRKIYKLIVYIKIEIGEKGMKKQCIAGIVVCLFICGSTILPTIVRSTTINPTPSESTKQGNNQNVTVTFYTYDRTSTQKHDTVLSLKDAEELYSLMKKWKDATSVEPQYTDTYQDKQNVLHALEDKGILSKKSADDMIDACEQPNNLPRIFSSKDFFSHSPLVKGNRATVSFCSIGSEGSGLLEPMFLLPRPRLVTFWIATSGATSVANLLTAKGVYATGKHLGVAFGFIGIGGCFAFPGAVLYIIVGYALLASVVGDNIQLYPPNQEPIISTETPSDNTYQVPTSIAELSFTITDPEADKMSYTVTTDPDIGSGSGINKGNGIYSIPISGLASDTLYIWTVQVSDGTHTVRRDFSFSTGEIPDTIVFSDDFNDNIKNLSKWTEIYTSGTWDETQMRTEFQISESGGGERYEGIESIPLFVPLSPNKPILISAEMLSDIAHESGQWVGYVWIEITDGTQWLRAGYQRSGDMLFYYDSIDETWQTLTTSRSEGIWENQIMLCSDKYSIHMDSYGSGWVHRTLFAQNVPLKLRIFIQLGGDYPELWWRAGFDTVNVKK